jgi:hypothetical protein
MGPPPLWLLSQTDLASERGYVLAPQGVFGSGDVFQVSGAIVQYCTAATAAQTLFRRTISARSGSRGVMV